jgi:hypothetical protein
LAELVQLTDLWTHTRCCLQRVGVIACEPVAEEQSDDETDDILACGCTSLYCSHEATLEERAAHAKSQAQKEQRAG